VITENLAILSSQSFVEVLRVPVTGAPVRLVRPKVRVEWLSFVGQNRKRGLYCLRFVWEVRV